MHRCRTGDVGGLSTTGGGPSEQQPPSAYRFAFATSSATRAARTLSPAVVLAGAVVAERGPDTRVGELSLLANMARSATLRALEPMTMAVIGAPQSLP